MDRPSPMRITDVSCILVFGKTFEKRIKFNKILYISLFTRPVTSCDLVNFMRFEAHTLSSEIYKIYHSTEIVTCKMSI